MNIAALERIHRHRDHVGVDADCRDLGRCRVTGVGAIALAHTERTLRSVSAPSSVVRSIIEIAVSMAQALDVDLTERVANPAARASAPTWSTPGSPCSHRVSEALVRAPTPSTSRAVAVAVVGFTAGVYRPSLGR